MRNVILMFLCGMGAMGCAEGSDWYVNFAHGVMPSWQERAVIEVAFTVALFVFAKMIDWRTSPTRPLEQESDR